MRSVELGRWFVRRLRALPPPTPGRCVDAASIVAIAAAVPGTNAVTRAEVAKHLADLTREACAAPDYAQALTAFEAAAFDPPAGVLLGMGYAPASPVALPA